MSEMIRFRAVSSMFVVWVLETLSPKAPSMSSYYTPEFAKASAAAKAGDLVSVPRPGSSSQMVFCRLQFSLLHLAIASELSCRDSLLAFLLEF